MKRTRDPENVRTNRSLIKRAATSSSPRLDYEKEMLRIHSHCPSYHCRTGQLRPDRIELVLIGTALCIFCAEELRRTIEAWLMG